jgi:NifU-like protein
LTNEEPTTRFASQIMPASLITQRFFAPVNVGRIESPDGTGSAASVTCGALLRVFLSVDEAQRITAAKFKVVGCSYLVASCSVLSEALRGKTTGEAAIICQSPASLRIMMGHDWPAEKENCLALTSQGFLAAIINYSDARRDEWSGAEALICTCFGVSEKAIESAIQAGGLHTIAEVTKASNAGAGCRSCHPLIEDILDQCKREGDVVFGEPR